MSPRLRAARALAVVVVLALVVGGVTYTIIRAARATDGVRPGQLWEKEGSLGLDYAHTLTFELPTGELVVKVATSVDTVPSFDAPDGLVDPGDDVHSGSEAQFVPIGWNLQGETSSVRDSPLYQFQVVLVADGHRYDLQAGTSTADPASAEVPVVRSKTMTAVVAGDGGGLVVEVSYDGLVQKGYVGDDHVDPGVAAPYYEDGGPRSFTASTPCRLFTRAQREVVDPGAFDCTVGEVRALPYVPGVGWVPSPDVAWAVVQVSVGGGPYLDPARGRGVYDVRAGAVRVSLDGRPPVRVLLPEASSVTRTALYVFRSTPTPQALRVEAPFTARLHGGRAPSVIRFGAHAPIALT